MQSNSHEHDFPFIALFFCCLLPQEKPSLFLILYMFYQKFPMGRRHQQKRKRNKEYNQTRSVFYIRWDATM